ncbi:MAG: LysR family transcriptional regulator [Defluviitaleaceae bacterium]|nr:LysR family transcriptional regulator [Defluviitaleaceae bacterium]
MYTHYFKYFEEVAKEKSFTKAAKNLYISQQSLSEHIKRMEEHYGVQLFVRRPSLHLTHAGELLLEHVGKTLHQEERLLAEFSFISSKQKGKIRVGITPTRAPIFFPLIFSEFNKLYPHVELSLREDHTTYLVTDFLEGKVDFIIGLEDINFAQKHIITSLHLLQDRNIYFLVSRKLLLQCGFPESRIDAALINGVKLTEIHEIPIILMLNKSNIHAKIAQEYLKINKKPKIVIESSNVYPLLPLYSAGNAGGFVSQTVLRYVTEQYAHLLDDVLAFPVRDIDINCDIALMYFSNKPVSVYFEDFIKTTQGVFAGYDLDNPV